MVSTVRSANRECGIGTDILDGVISTGVCRTLACGACNANDLDRILCQVAGQSQ